MVLTQMRYFYASPVVEMSRAVLDDYCCLSSSMLDNNCYNNIREREIPVCIKGLRNRVDKNLLMLRYIYTQRSAAYLNINEIKCNKLIKPLY